MIRKVLHISDWHTQNIEGMLSKYQSAWGPDLILVTGDMVKDMPGFLTKKDSEEGRAEMGKWQRAIWVSQAQSIGRIFPGVPIVAVPGNHDFCDYSIDGLVQSFDDGTQTFVVNDIRITGFRGVPYICNWWSYELEMKAFKKLIRELDPKADILVTHSPPFGALDIVERREKGVRPFYIHVGIEGLKEWLIKHPTVQLHAFGHIHNSGGKTEQWYGTTLSNASCSLNEILIDV